MESANGRYDVHKRAVTLAMEDIPSNAFPDGHSKVDVESYPRDSDTRIALVGRRKVGIFVVMVMGVTRVSASLDRRCRGHVG
jgi:hypothetical protein